MTYVTTKEDANMVMVTGSDAPAWCHATVSQLTSRSATVVATCQHSNEHMVKVVGESKGREKSFHLPEWPGHNQSTSKLLFEALIRAVAKEKKTFSPWGNVTIASKLKV